MPQTNMLVTQEPVPQSVKSSDLVPKVPEVEHNTEHYGSSELAMAGFRSAKYLTEEWYQNNNIRCHQAFTDCDQSECNRQESKHLAAETKALSQRTQQDTNKKVGERLQDVHFWKSELQREIEDLMAETDLLIAQKLRLQRALDATEVPFSISMDNLQCRERRQPPDRVKDVVEMELLKEAELIRNVQELLKRTLMQIVNQISASTPEMWGKYCQENVCRAQREKTASVNLRLLIDNILNDSSKDLCVQCDAVNLAFSRGCQEIENAKNNLEHHLRKILREITDQENNISSLKQAIKDKEAPLRVAETRLYQRSQRPNVDLCRDNAQIRLASEVEELTMSIKALKEKLMESEHALKNLEGTQMILEKEISIKNNSLFIDRQKCMTHRSRYPTILRLTGYQ
ncbi:tektin-4 isoform X2 [Sarcophilus harrisii]|uniref:tektin-4 isoform X2 n=1 Tax=Sarcophilus harrisii TaxID=9305 RepID=UPI0013020667|nr:tektin-4 isoform X2 [Sarcophilus harrisii]